MQKFILPKNKIIKEFTMKKMGFYMTLVNKFSDKKEINNSNLSVNNDGNNEFKNEDNINNRKDYNNKPYRRDRNRNDNRNFSENGNYRRDRYQNNNNNNNNDGNYERNDGNYNGYAQRRYRNNDNNRNNYSNRSERMMEINADTIWGKRYNRNGYIDSNIHHRTHKLFELANKNSETTSSEEKELIYDNEVFKELNVYFQNKPVIMKEELGKTINEFNSIDDYDLEDILKQNLKKMKINKLAPIQHRVLSLCKEKKDIIGCAQTGSGKTLAFLLPLINNMLRSGPPEFKHGFEHEHLINGMSYPTSLIISPTRELANQIYDECLKLCYNTGIVPAVVFGGERREIQNMQIEKGVDIVIATPGRLIDFLNYNLKLKYVETLVLDEADMMLDLGFEEQLHQIMSSFDLPHKSKRKNLFFSATFESEIISIANDFLNEYFFIGNKDKAFTLNKKIEQNFIYIEGERISTILDIMNKNKNSKIMLFTNSKIDCKSINEILQKNGFNSCAIHGDCEQNQRMRMLNNFKNGSCNILCATDVASRGLDISNVDLVVNYEVPQNIDAYVHRIGRTGRKGKDGQVITLLSNLSQYNTTKELKKLLIKENINHSSDVDLCLEKCDKRPMKNMRSKGYNNRRDNNWDNRDRNFNNNSRSFNENSRNFFDRNSNSYKH